VKIKKINKCKSLAFAKIIDHLSVKNVDSISLYYLRTNDKRITIRSIVLYYCSCMILVFTIVVITSY